MSKLLRSARAIAPRRAAVALVVGGWAFGGGVAPARADLGRDAARVADHWRSEGAEVIHLAPTFMDDFAVRAFETRAGVAPCTTVLALADRQTELVLYGLAGAPYELPPGGRVAEQGDEDDAMEQDDAGEDDGAAEGERFIESDRGIATMTRCGEARAELERVLVELVTIRGAVEIVVAHSAAVLTDPARLLPERVEGPLAPQGDPGGPLPPGALDERLSGAERRAKTAGAKHVVQVPMRASSHGTGVFEVRIGEGCHRLEVMAQEDRSFPIDVDVEVRVAETGEVLERDRGDAPDGRVDVCVGETTVVGVAYMGAPGSSRVVLSSAMWTIPTWIPSGWGSRARAAFATAWRRRPTPAPRSGPVAEAIGAQGLTSVPIEVEPDTCYFAAVAMTQGESSGIRLRAQVGGRGALEEIPGRPEGALVAFCTTLEESARVEVEVRGQAPSWLLAVWRLGRR